MKNIDDLCVIVQSRLNSERVPRKMLKPFAGTTLFENVIDTIKKTKLGKKNFYVSVFEQELKDIASSKGVKIFNRSEKSAESEAIRIGELFEWWNKLPFTYVIVVNGCCPFLKPETIDNFISNCKDNADFYSGLINIENIPPEIEPFKKSSGFYLKERKGYFRTANLVLFDGSNVSDKKREYMESFVEKAFSKY